MEDLLGTKAQGALILSRFKGANEMDAPSKYFLGLEKKNGQGRLIHTLHTGNGQYTTHTDEIRRYAIDFYQDLYRSEHRDSKELLDTFYQGLPKVSSEDNAALEGPLVLKELQVALNTMPGGKAPGIDSLPVEFYKFFWKELGEDLLEVLEESCRERCLPLSSRRAVITLLPKKGDLQDIKNWHPVSLLCTDYKKALGVSTSILLESMAAQGTRVYDTLTRRHGVRVLTGASVEEFSLAAGEVVGHANVVAASWMNSVVVLFLNTVERATKLEREVKGIVIGGSLTHMFPLSAPSK
ncbi:hypothetical protein QTP86_001554 [Hemibagrus guttatus]|nr:hypothetical protein QTP86_001554 [Hemibagrus guttatus]